VVKTRKIRSSDHQSHGHVRRAASSEADAGTHTNETTQDVRRRPAGVVLISAVPAARIERRRKIEDVKHVGLHREPVIALTVAVVLTFQGAIALHSTGEPTWYVTTDDPMLA
jgi:hypothetical protein